MTVVGVTESNAGEREPGVDRISREELVELEARIYERWREIFHENFEKGGAYTKAVITVGYAGYFTSWNLTKDVLSEAQMALAALAVLISGCVFISWEVYAMLRRNESQKRLGRVIRVLDRETLARLSEYEEQERQFEINVTPWYTGVVAVTVLSAMVGIITLVSAYASILWNKI